ncbi:unnamed protein product [Calypogeia fissa]
MSAGIGRAWWLCFVWLARPGSRRECAANVIETTYCCWSRNAYFIIAAWSVRRRTGRLDYNGWPGPTQGRWIRLVWRLLVREEASIRAAEHLDEKVEGMELLASAGSSQGSPLEL